MPQILPKIDALANPMSPPEPVAALFWDGTNWHVATVDLAGHVQVDIVTSGLPLGAATAAAQALILAQLQLIEDMRDALQSVATDRLIVRGEDQLFSIKGVLSARYSGAISGAGGSGSSPACPADEIWIVTTIAVADNTTATTKIRILHTHDAVGYRVKDEIKAFAIDEYCSWSGHIYLDHNDVVTAIFTGSLAGDTVTIDITGYRMTLEV